MILGALFAANCLLPPGPYQDPRSEIHIQFVDRATVHKKTTELLRPWEWTGIEWGFNPYGARGMTLLSIGSSKQESCELRHALGHFTDYERTGDPNPRHLGWEYQE